MKGRNAMRDLEKVMERLGLDEYVSVSEFNQLQSKAAASGYAVDYGVCRSAQNDNKKICKYLYRNSV